MITLDDSEIDKDSSGDDTYSSYSSSDDSSSDNDVSTEESARSPLSDDIEQYEIMLEAYQKVGVNYEVKEERLVGGLEKLQVLEGVPRRWPLARLTFPLRMVIAQLDRVLAGCCWEVLIAKPLLREASKGLTLLLAGWLAEEIASILREITSHTSQKLYDEETIHLLCANYWLLPIYQELLHTATRYNVTSEGERKRPCSGLAKILAHQKPVKTQAKRQNEHTKTVSDWIGGLCDADSLYVWFPAHWVPHLLRRLEAREDEYRQQHHMWFDRELPDDELLEDQQKAKAGRKLQFGVRPCDDNIRQLTGSIRADWLQLSPTATASPKRGSGWYFSGQSGSTMGGNQRSPPASLLLPPE